MMFGLAPCPCTGVGSDAFQGGNDTRGSIETNHTQPEARRKARHAHTLGVAGRRSQSSRGAITILTLYVLHLQIRARKARTSASCAWPD